jgi:putative ABC transport system ATP-binding protein
MTSNAPALRTLVSDESVVGCTLDEVCVVVLGDRYVVVSIAREAAIASGFEVADVPDEALLGLGVLPRPILQAPHAPQARAPEPATVATYIPQTQVPNPAQSNQPPVNGPVPHSARPVFQAERQTVPQELPLQPTTPVAPVEVAPVVVPPVAVAPAPAQAPDFSAWPYVDRRTLTIDDDVPTAQNFLNAAIASERRGRNADIAQAPVAPFGDVPRAYESAASDTRAKPETPAAAPAPRSTVAIGMASLPKAPAPTVVPSPGFVAMPPLPRSVVIPGPLTPSMPLPLPTVAPIEPPAMPVSVPAPSISVPDVSAPLAAAPMASATMPTATVPAPTPQATVPALVKQTLESAPAAPTVLQTQATGDAQQTPPPSDFTDDIAESPLARLLASQAFVEETTTGNPAEMAVAPSVENRVAQLVAGNSEPVVPALVELRVPVGATTNQSALNAVPSLSSLAPNSGLQNSDSIGPFAAPKVGRVETVFDMSPPAVAAPESDLPAPSAWAEVATTSASELTPVRSPFEAPQTARPTETPGAQHHSSSTSSVTQSELFGDVAGQAGESNSSSVFSLGLTDAESAQLAENVPSETSAPRGDSGSNGPAANQPTPNQPTSNEPKSNEPASNAASHQATSNEPASNQATSNQATSNQPASNQSTSAGSGANEPAPSAPTGSGSGTLAELLAKGEALHFDSDEDEESLPLLAVSDRLVLRWHANAEDELRVSSMELSVGWPGSKPLISKLDIDLQTGDLLVIDGPERSGKSALLRTFAGHLAPLGGEIQLDGRSLGSIDGTDFRRREALSLSYVGANSVLVPDLSLVENIELPLLAEGVSPHDARPAALAWLESTGLSADAHHPAGALSSSDARIATVIRTLIVGPGLVCVDDVTSGMGIHSARMVLALLEHAQSNGAVLLVATNDARLEFVGGYRASIEVGELVPVG